MNATRLTTMPTAADRRSELLMPAGSLRKLKIAVLYGADAVYCGTPDMSLRTKSEFTLEEVVEGIEFAHERGVRVYLTLNLFSHNRDIAKLDTYIDTVRTVKPDGLIIADPGIFDYVKQRAPEIPLHISTQSNVCSWLTVQFWEKQGADLCVLAREVSFEELSEIREKCPDIKLEAFVPGSMCMTYSGRCLLSNFLSERGANQGSCTNSCRWNYKLKIRLKDGTIGELPLNDDTRELFEFLLEEEHRPGDFMPIEEDDRGAYILNAKDLCLMPVLSEYLRIGVDSLKVEGRGKSEYYVGIVARAYRMAIDDYYADPENWNPKAYIRELDSVGNRGYSLAFHEGRLTHHAHNYEHTQTIAPWEYAGMIAEVTDDAFIIEVKNRLDAGDVLEFVSPVSNNDQARETVLLRVYDFEQVGKTGRVTVLHAGQKPVIRIPFSAFDHEDAADLAARFPAFSIVRKEKALSEAEWERLRLDKLARSLEVSGKENEAAYQKKLGDLQTAIDEDTKDMHVKSPRLGTEGCCGRGCNGCLVFWSDPLYARHREALAKRKQGEQLKPAEIRQLKAVG